MPGVLFGMSIIKKYMKTYFAYLLTTGVLKISLGLFLLYNRKLNVIKTILAIGTTIVIWCFAFANTFVYYDRFSYYFGSSELPIISLILILIVASWNNSMAGNA